MIYDKKSPSWGKTIGESPLGSQRKRRTELKMRNFFPPQARMERGSGVKRIREALAVYGLKPPLIQANGDWFSITFMRKGPHDAVERLQGNDKVFIPSDRDDIEGISEGVNALLEFIRKTPGLRLPQISKAMGVPVHTLEHWINELRIKNRIEFKGSPKTGGYRKKESQSEG
jgi:ATP-dependent DNA helicase RecG